MRTLLPLLALVAVAAGLATWWARREKAAGPAPAPERESALPADEGSPTPGPARIDAAPAAPAPPASRPVVITRPEDLDPELRERYLDRWRAHREELLAERMAARREAEDRWFAELGLRLANEFGLAPGTEADLAALFSEERDRLEEAGREARANPDRVERRRLLDQRLREIHAWKVGELERRYGPDLAGRILRYVEGDDEREEPADAGDRSGAASGGAPPEAGDALAPGNEPAGAGGSEG